MSWYYAENNERRGPVSQTDFDRLVAAGTIRPETLVWREGLPEWTAYSAVAGAKVTSSGPGLATPNAGSEPSFGSAVTPTLSEASALSSVGTASESRAEVCSQCSRLLPADEMISYEGRYVCAQCKPAFFQRVREGASVEQFVYAGFWIRFVAKIVDSVILQIVMYPLGAVLTPALPAPDAKNPFSPLFFISLSLGLFINLAYNAFFVGKFGATPGKMALGLKIIKANGERLNYVQAVGRFFAEILSGLTLTVGYLMAAFDSEKRALHDRICDTRVVKK